MVESAQFTWWKQLAWRLFISKCVTAKG